MPDRERFFINSDDVETLVYDWGQGSMTISPEACGAKTFSADLQRQAHEMATQIGSRAREAAKQARIAGMDLRNSFHSGDEGRTLVLPAGAPQPELFGAAHEDLSVMSRILTKAVEKESRRGNYRGFSFALGEARNRALDAMYLEGYGAVFMLNADFPLAAPPPPDASKSVSKDEDSTWERTKRELRGQGEAGDDDEGSTDLFSLGEESPKFDAEKVTSLQRRLIDSLKHAKNLRSVKEDEHVTVVVLGKSTGKRTQVTKIRTAGRRGGAAGSSGESSEDDLRNSNSPEMSVRSGGGGGGSSTATIAHQVVGYVNTDSVRQTTLVIRAKKSDILRFAAGQLTSEEFVKTASASAY